MSLSFPESNPDQLAAAHAVIERVVTTDPATVRSRTLLLDAIEGASDAIGMMVVGHGAIPSLQTYEEAHFYNEEQLSVYVLRQSLGRMGLVGPRRYFCAFRPTTRGAYMAMYSRISEMTRVHCDILLPDTIDTRRLEYYSPAAYETDGRAAYARDFRGFGSARIAMPGARDCAPDESRQYFKILQHLSDRLLKAAGK